MWASYVAFTLIMFPKWNSNVIVPFIPIMALGGWLYGRTRALMLVIPALMYHSLLLSFLFADLVIYYEDRAVGSLIVVVVVLLTGTLRNKLDAIKATNHKLDRLVAERNAELDTLASKLIAESEQTRISLGQELHDGIGQHLTGINLFCTTLADRLHGEQNPNVSLADALVDGITHAHNQIRRIARMLFPIQISRTGLFPALGELASCVQDIHHVEFSVAEPNALPNLTEHTALQLYRICQETANYALDHLKAKQIRVRLSASADTYNLEFQHDGSPLRFEDNSNALRLIDYRLRQISATTTKITGLQTEETTMFSFPNPEMEPFS